MVICLCSCCAATKKLKRFCTTSLHCMLCQKSFSVASHYNPSSTEAFVPDLLKCCQSGVGNCAAAAVSLTATISVGWTIDLVLPLMRDRLRKRQRPPDISS